MAAYTTIDDPTAYFQIELYTGTGSSHARTFDSDTAMQPDLVWIKSRSGGYQHELYDAVRGVQKRVVTGGTDESAEEKSDSNSLTAFGSDGFTVGSRDQVNQGGGSAKTYVAWGWKESATAGFDIDTYTGNGTSGRTEAHSLSATPDFFVVKRTLSDGDAWRVFHKNNTTAPATDYLVFNTDGATADNAAMWNDTAPDSSNFTLGNAGSTNENTKTFISYLFRGVQGYSKVGVFTGNGNADGTFVYTGFRPAFILYKKSAGGAASQWYLWDNKRAGYNPTNNILFTNLTNDEEVYNYTDIHSNGFKQKTSYSAVNESASTYIYYAVAEAPLVNSEGVPCNAR